MSDINIEGLPDDLDRSAVSIGIFDGVHVGHQTLLAVLRSRAEQLGVPAIALTFDRHPTELLAPDRVPKYISTLKQKLELLGNAGVDHVAVVRFDHGVADLSPEDFVERILVEKLKAKSVVVGTNFRFGHKRIGDVEQLRELGRERDFGVISVEPVVVQGATVSSTRVRKTIERGEVDVAAKLLGRPFTLLGRVVHGKEIGRTLGFPTANIEAGPRQLVPPDGVYAVQAVVDGVVWPGACGISTRPTFDGTERTIEVIIDGFSGNIYGVELPTIFYRKLRDPVKFDSPESLAEQLRKDVEDAKKCLPKNS